MALIVGDITNRVRNSAMPTSTWLGGVVEVPIAERMKPRTMRIRVKPVTVNRIAGISDSPPISSRICSAFEESIFISASVADGHPAQAVDDSVKRLLGRVVVVEVLGEVDAGGDGLVLGVGLDRRDAVLADAEQDDVGARAQQRDGLAVGDRQRGDLLQAVSAGADRVTALDGLEDLRDRVDD